MRNIAKENMTILCLSLFFGVIGFFLSGSVFLFSLFFAVCYIIYKNTPGEDRRFVVGMLISGFLLRVVIALLLHAYSYMTGYEGFTSGDDTLYSLRSWALVYQWEGKPYIWARAFAAPLEHGLTFFTYILAFFYKIFGFHPAAAKIINCIIGSLIGWTAYLIGKELFDAKAARLSMAIVTFYPSLIRWSAANLKDPVMILLFMLSCYFLIRLLQHSAAVVHVCLLIMSLITLHLFLNKFLFVLIGAGTVIVLFSRITDLIGKRKRIRNFLFLMLGCGMLGFAYYVFYVNPQKVLRCLYMLDYTQRTIARSDYAGYYIYTKDFLMLINKGIFSLTAFLFVLAKSAVYFMLSPFPWQMVSRGQLIAFPQMLIWYLILILSFFGFIKLSIKNIKTAFFIGAVLFIGISVRSLSEGNIGAAFRHRDVFSSFFIIFASTAVIDLINDRKNRLKTAVKEVSK